MDLSWNQLAPLMSVPHLPTLGALHPKAVGPQVLRDVLTVAGTGQFLSYDKDRRWGGQKAESIVDGVEVHADHVLIPTLNQRTNTVTVHLYGQPAPKPLGNAHMLARRARASHEATAARVMWFMPPGTPPPSGVAATRVQMHTFAIRTSTAHDAIDPTQAEPVTTYDELPTSAAATFADLATALADDGFAFLYKRMRQDQVGPVLTVARDRRVVGAIGPMQTLPDLIGQPRLLPQYFGVLPEFRRQGLGRALWQAAMCWGSVHGAAYQILNTVLDGTSDHLCRTEHLTDLGTICTTPA